jgi:Ca2+-binding RTX toxin-like protein
LNGSHDYPTGGMYTVTITLSDDDTGTDAKTATVHVTGVGILNGTLYVVGTTSDDKVKINNTGKGDFKVHTDFRSKKAEKNFDGEGVTQIVVATCDGDDDVDINGSISLLTLLDGGAGADKLKGGKGPNILLGGNGDDKLDGGNSRDLIIGGQGADTLEGHQQDDILIAGYTAYDANHAALFAIMAEWRKDDAANGYAQRVAKLSSGSFAHLLIGNDGASQTVFEDSDVDTLKGSAGTDWFFANQVADNGGPRDIVRDKAAIETWLDTDF